MSYLTSYVIVAFVLLNTIGCFWLLKWTAKAQPWKHDSDAGAATAPAANPDAASEIATTGHATTGHVWDHDLREYNNPLPRWWLNMFYLSIVFAIGYLLLYPGLGNKAGLLGWNSQVEHDRMASSERAAYIAAFEPLAALDFAQLGNDPKAMQMAQNIFNNSCAACHGADGHGAKGFPNLSDADWLYGGEPDAITLTLREGRVGAMPGWQAVVGADGVAALVAYVQQLSGAPIGSFNSEQAATGLTQYMQLCLACHGPDGKGNPAMGAPNLTDQIWLYGGDAATLTETLANGRAGVMPAQTSLTEAQIKVMTAWVMAQSQIANLPANPTQAGAVPAP